MATIMANVELQFLNSLSHEKFFLVNMTIRFRQNFVFKGIITNRQMFYLLNHM